MTSKLEVLEWFKANLRDTNIASDSYSGVLFWGTFTRFHTPECEPYTTIVMYRMAFSRQLSAINGKCCQVKSFFMSSQIFFTD